MSGNMYDWITGTWNPFGGECPHRCSYCYVKSFRWPILKEKYSGPPRLIDHELKKNLGSMKFWFVGSCFDMWANEIPMDWLLETLKCCFKYQKNKYLFQSKNPKKMFFYLNLHSMARVISTVGTTIETNRVYREMGNAPETFLRVFEMNRLSMAGFETMVTIEPLMDFDIFTMLDFVEKCRPKWVNIGADSGGHNLPEPPKEKILELIEELKKFTEVKLKKNLNRLIR